MTTTGTQTYTGAVTISTDAITLTTTNNQITFSSTVNSAASAAHAINFNVGNAEVEFDGIVGGADNGDLGAIGITGNLDLDANIVGAASLAVSGTANLGGSITTTGTQTYSGAVTLSAATITLTTTDSDVTFGGTIDSDAGQTRHLTIDTNGTTGTIQFGGLVGNTVALGAIGITGNLDLDANIVGAASLAVSGSSNLGADVTTTGTQTYSGAVTLSAATITLTTTNSDVTFGGTIDSDAGQTNHLTIDTNGTTGTIQFGGLVGNTVALGAIGITGNLDLDANIVGAASLAVSGSSNLGASVTTTGNQTYTGAVTLSADVTLTTTNNGDVSFSNVVDGDYDLQVSTHGTGDTTFAQAVGANTALNNITITTDEFTAAAIKADGTFSLTNLTASTISGILSETSALALTKAGVGNLTLTAVHTFTGDTTISAGDVIVGGSGQLGSGSYGGAISLASGSTLSFGSSVSQTLSGVISGDGDVEKVTSAASTLTLSGDNTYTGGTNVSAGYLQSGSSSGASPPTSGPFGTATVTVASGAVLDVNGQTVGNAINLSGTGISENGALINSHATAATISGDITLAAHTSVGGAHAVTLSGAISGTGINFTKVGASTYTLSNTNTYTGDTTISAGTLKLTGNLNSATDLVIAPSATLDLQAALTAATLDLDGTISNTAGTSSLIISGTSSLGGSITTTGTQTYNNAVTLTGDTTLATSSAQVTFAANATINSEGSETNNLTITASETELNGVIGYTRTLGVIDINGNLDLNAAITNATSMDVSGTANLGADVTTTGTQAYQDAVTLSADVILTTTDSNITFTSTLRSDAAESARDLTVNLDANSDGTSADLILNGVVGGVSLPLDVISITGDLDLNASIGNSPGATSIIVSGDTNLGADVETTGTQTYQGAVTVSADITLTTTNSNIDFDAIVNADTAGRALTLAAGSGDVTFDNAIGGSTALGNLNITTGALTAGAIKAQGTITVNNSASSAITGIISDGATAAILTKTGAGTLSLSGTNTYTGQTNINTGTLAVTVNDALGSNAAGTVIASGATLDLQNVNYTTTEAITNNGGTLATSTGTSAYAGVMTLGADSTVDVDGTQLTISTAIGDGSGGYAITKDGNGTLVLSATSTYTGDTTISNGTLTVTGTLADTTDVSVASGATYDVDQTDTIQSLSGAGTINIASTNILTFGDANDKTIDGVIEGDGSIVKVGSSTYTLSGNNTYTGLTTISNGVIAITHNNALGTTAGTTTVASGAALHLSNNITVAEAITIGGTGISTNGAIRNVADSNTLSGLITLAADAEIQIDTGTTLALNVASGNAITGTFNLTMDSVGTSSIADPIATSTGNLTKTGAGTLTLSGNSTYTGTTTISVGTISLTHANGLGTTGGSTTIESGAQLTIATDLIVAEDMNISGTGISSAGVINSSGAITLSGDINVVATSSIITTGNLTLSGNIIKTSGSNATLTISTDAQLQFTNASAITATNNALSLDLTSDADLSGNEVIKLGANITTNGGSLTINSDTYLTKYIEVDTTGTSDGAVTFSGLVQGYIEDENRVILTGSGGYYYYDVTNSTAYNPVSQTYGTATLDGTLASGGSVSLGDGTLGWNGTQYTWTPDHSGDVEYLILGGGASGTRGQWGEYYGGGGGAGAVEEGSLTVTGSTGYNAVVGAGGDKETGVYTNYSSMGDGVDGIDGGDSTFSSVTATGGYASVNDLVADARGGHKAAWGGNSGNGNSGGYGGAFSCGECNAGGGGGSLSAGSGKNGGAGVTSGITGTNVEYGSGGAGLGSGTSYGTSSGGAGSSSRTYALANTGSGGSDATSVHPGYAGNGGSGLVVIAYDNGLTIDSGSAQVTLSGDVTKLSNLDITSSYDGSTISGIVSGLTPITYTGPTAGELIVSADNTFTGNVNVISGALSITHNNALGTTAGTTTVASGAALHLSNNITVAEAITIGGTGISTNGAIRNVADSNTLSGLITLAADAEIQIDTGTTLALNVASGNAITGTFNLTMDSVGTSSIADPIATSTGNLTKTGAGTLTLSGTNTYTGDTTISAGTLKLTGNLNSATDLVIAPSATLDLQAALTAATLDLDGTISNTAGTSSLIISGTSSLGGSITTTGTQTYNNAVTLTGDTTLATSSAQVTFAANATINSEGSETNNLTITASEDGIEWCYWLHPHPRCNRHQR